MENIVVVGGIAAVKNLLPRLSAELYNVVEDIRFAEKLRNPKFRFVSTGKIPPNIVGWRGCTLWAVLLPQFCSILNDSILVSSAVQVVLFKPLT